MKFTLLKRPAAIDEFPAWIESMILSDECERFLGDLHSVSTPHEHLTGLDEILGDLKPRVMRHGIRDSIPPEVARKILRHPTALEELVHEIVICDEPYWTSRLNLPESPSITIPQVASLDEEDDDGIIDEPPTRFRFSGPAGVPGQRMTGTSAATIPPPVTENRPGPAAWLTHKRAGFALAATLLIMAGVLLLKRRSGDANGKPGDPFATIAQNDSRSNQPEPPWGWTKPDAFASGKSASAYLNQLASLADDWFERDVANASRLRGRLVDFRKGCDLLLAARHEPLAPAEREWLHERCQEWSGSIDGLIGRLDRGESMEKVRDEADVVVGKLIDALRLKGGRADQSSIASPKNSTGFVQTGPIRMVDDFRDRSTDSSDSNMSYRLRRKLGVILDPVPYRVFVLAGKFEQGMRVARVEPDTPAFGRIDPGDIIVKINDIPTPSHVELLIAIERGGPELTILGWNVRTGRLETFPQVIPMQ